jgi:hypothetical protein
LILKKKNDFSTNGSITNHHLLFQIWFDRWKNKEKKKIKQKFEFYFFMKKKKFKKKKKFNLISFCLKGTK